MKSSRFIRTKVDFHGNPTSILYFLHEKFIWNLVLSRSSQCFGSVSEPIKMQETIYPVLVVARTDKQATFSDVTEITREILKISLKFPKMASIFVEARGCDGTNLCFIERPRYFLGSLLVSGSKTF